MKTHDSAPPIGMLAPDFLAFTREGTLSLDRWQGGAWLVLVSISGAEATAFDAFLERAAEFAARGVKVLGLSLTRTGGTAEVPMARIDGRTARALGLVEEGVEGLRPALIVLDPMRAVRAALYYPTGTARSVDGALRLVEALREGDAWITSRFRKGAIEEPADRGSEVDRHDGSGEDPLTDEPPFGFSRPVIA